MLADQKKTQLTDFLGQVPDEIAARLARAIEIDRLVGNTGLPHDDILKALRPQLTKAGVAPRTPSPQRFFCRPFEDLLVSEVSAKKRKGRIARASIQPVWNWLSTELIPEAHAALITRIRFAILNSRDDEVQAKCAELWNAASAALKDALRNERTRVQVVKKLGPGTTEDAAEIAVVLSAAQSMLALQEIVPKPLPALTEEHTLQLRGLYDRLVEIDPDAAPYVALVTMRRLAKPYEALRLAAVVSKKTTDTVISATDLGAVGEVLFDDMETHAAKLTNIRPPDFEINSLLEHLAAFTEISSGIVKELGIRRDGAWGQRLSKTRSAVAASMEALLDRAPKEIMAALPHRSGSGFANRPQPLDLSHAPDGERVVRAMRYACLIAHTKPFAVAASFNAKLGDVTEKAATELRAVAEELLEATRAADKATFAEQYFEIAADLCSQVLGAEDAELLRRRARVAA